MKKRLALLLRALESGRRMLHLGLSPTFSWFSSSGTVSLALRGRDCLRGFLRLLNGKAPSCLWVKWEWIRLMEPDVEYRSEWWQAPVLSIPGAPPLRRAEISRVSRGGLQPRHMYTKTSWMFWSFKVGSSKCLLLFILCFHWRSSSWAPGLARCSPCCRRRTCRTDIQWLLGTCTGSLHGEHSQALSPSRRPAPCRYMFSGCWASLGPCTPSPEWFRRQRERQMSYSSLEVSV